MAAMVGDANLVKKLVEECNADLKVKEKRQG